MTKRLICLLVLLVALTGCSSDNELVTNKEGVVEGVETGKTKTYNLGVKLEGFEDYNKEVIVKDDTLLKAKVEPASREVVEFEGLKVKLRKGIPAQALDYKKEDYLEMIKNEAPEMIQTQEDGTSMSIVTLEDIANIVEGFIDDYPKLGKMTEEDIAKIKEDFLGITEEQVGEFSDVIEEAYRAQQSYTVFRNLINQSDEFQKRQQYGDFHDKDLTWAEKQICAFDPIKAYLSKSAIVDAERYSKAWAKELHDDEDENSDKRPDALRHMLWNFFMAKMVADNKYMKNDSVGRGVNWAKKIGWAHEAKDGISYSSIKNNNLKTLTTMPAAAKMDLHNNEVARNYFEDESSTETKGFWFWEHDVLKTVSDSTAISYFKNEINNGIWLNKARINTDDIDHFIDTFDFDNLGFGYVREDSLSSYFHLVNFEHRGVILKFNYEFLNINDNNYKDLNEE